MQVVLLKDVAGVGKKHEVKNVAEGHARNLLIPQGFAVYATAEKMKAVQLEHVSKATERQLQGDLLMKSLTSLNGTVVIIEAKANEKGHLFKGIHKADIAAAIKQRAHFEIPEEGIDFSEPLKELGEFPVIIKAEGFKGSFMVRIERETE